MYCANHGDNTTRATVISEKFGPLCARCDSVLHRRKSMAGCKRVPIEADNEADAPGGGIDGDGETTRSTEN